MGKPVSKSHINILMMLMAKYLELRSSEHVVHVSVSSMKRFMAEMQLFNWQAPIKKLNEIRNR